MVSAVGFPSLEGAAHSKTDSTYAPWAPERKCILPQIALGLELKKKKIDSTVGESENWLRSTSVEPAASARPFS